MFKDAKAGDKVWSTKWGWGKIVDILEDTDYPLVVKFNIKNKPTYTFTVDGKYNKNDIIPTVFWDEIKFKIPEKPKAKFWEPEDDELAYYVDSVGILNKRRKWDMNNVDKDRVEQGNVFKTKEEAEKEVELRKAKYRVKKRIWELNDGEFIEFKQKHDNYSFDLYSNEIVPRFCCKTKSYPNWQYIKTEKLVKQLINEMYDDLLLIRNE